MIYLHLTTSKRHKHKTLINASKWGIKLAGRFKSWALETNCLWKLAVSALIWGITQRGTFKLSFLGTGLPCKCSEYGANEVRWAIFIYTFTGLVLLLHRWTQWIVCKCLCTDKLMAHSPVSDRAMEVLPCVIGSKLLSCLRRTSTPLYQCHFFHLCSWWQFSLPLPPTPGLSND